MGTFFQFVDRSWVRVSVADDQPSSATQVGMDGFRIVPYRNEGIQGTALLLESGMTAVVNGETVYDMALLSDRDEIVVGSQRVYFSNETLPVVSTFQLAEGARRPNCGICRGSIEDNDLVVRCPRCTRWFHQSDGREHWTYRSECPFCKHPTSLTGESAWKPETEDGDVD